MGLALRGEEAPLCATSAFLLATSHLILVDPNFLVEGVSKRPQTANQGRDRRISWRNRREHENEPADVPMVMLPVQGGDGKMLAKQPEVGKRDHG